MNRALLPFWLRRRGLRVVFAWLGSVLALAEPPAEDRPRAIPPHALTREECDLLFQQHQQNPDLLRQKLGQPRHICRQILSHRYLEQWLYEDPSQVRVEVDFSRRKKPR